MGQNLFDAWSVATVKRKVADDVEEQLELHASLLYAGIGRVANELGGPTGSLDVREDGVTLSEQRESMKGDAYIGYNTSNYNPLLSCSRDSYVEFRVVTGDAIESV